MICYSRVTTSGQNFIKSQYELFFNVPDDEKAILEALEKELEKHGYTFVMTERPTLTGNTVILTIQKIKGQPQTTFNNTVTFVKQMFYLISTTVAEFSYEFSNQPSEISTIVFSKT